MNIPFPKDYTDVFWWVNSKCRVKMLVKYNFVWTMDSLCTILICYIIRGLDKMSTKPTLVCVTLSMCRWCVYSDGSAVWVVGGNLMNEKYNHLTLWQISLCSSYVDELVQERRISCALSTELLLSCTNPSICQLRCDHFLFFSIYLGIFMEYKYAATLDMQSILSLFVIAGEWAKCNTLTYWGPNGRYFADDTFKLTFLNENVGISTKISLKFIPKGPINNIAAMVQIMAWCRSGDKPLSEPVMVSLMTQTHGKFAEPLLGQQCANKHPSTKRCKNISTLP